MIETSAWERFAGTTGSNVSAWLSEYAQETIPLGIHGAPEDIASAVLYFASDASRYVAGADILVDGGMSVAPAGPAKWS